MAIEYKYAASTDIKVYPTALRGGADWDGKSTIVDPESRLATEFNTTNPVNRLTINGSFVISYDGSIMELSIHGYYFKINNLANIISNLNNPDKVYATIKIDNLSSGDYSLASLVALDGTYTNLDNDAKQFIALGFSSSIENTNGMYSLNILEKSGRDYVVPHSSYFMFDSDKVMIDTAGNTMTRSLHDVINVNNNKVTISSDEFEGHLTGNVTGNLDGNTKTATDSVYSEKIGTSTNHPSVGSNVKPVYINGDGKIVASDGNVGSHTADVTETMYMQNGELKRGIKITRSKNGPTKTGSEQAGDIWIQYI